MKVIGINGSPHAEGNTYHGLATIKKELEANGIEMEILHIGNKAIRGCIACNQCMKNGDQKCVLPDDGVNAAIEKMVAAEGIVLASPVYYANIAGTMKCFLDRVFYAAGRGLRGKVGTSIAAVRRTGGMPTVNGMNAFIDYCEMMKPTGNYWNVIHGTKPGDVLQDAEGMQTMEVLGRNMAYLLKQRAVESDVKMADPVRKTYTNFIR
ncbi:MAG: flavodoxin family protein [Clostridia bacterium]|nr:flavodoxin family protein [Clostridia bacterium]